MIGKDGVGGDAEFTVAGLALPLLTVPAIFVFLNYSTLRASLLLQAAPACLLEKLLRLFFRHSGHFIGREVAEGFGRQKMLRHDRLL